MTKPQAQHTQDLIDCLRALNLRALTPSDATTRQAIITALANGGHPHEPVHLPPHPSVSHARLVSALIIDLDDPALSQALMASPHLNVSRILKDLYHHVIMRAVDDLHTSAANMDVILAGLAPNAHLLEWWPVLTRMAVDVNLPRARPCVEEFVRQCAQTGVLTPTHMQPIRQAYVPQSPEGATIAQLEQIVLVCVAEQERILITQSLHHHGVPSSTPKM